MRNSVKFVGAKAYSFFLAAYLFLALAGFLVLLYGTPAGRPAAALIALNFAAFVLCGYDKNAARRSGMRVPEALLFSAALLGGSLGLLAGMRLFRHKTRKGSFQLVLLVIAVLQAFIIKNLLMTR